MDATLWVNRLRLLVKDASAMNEYMPRCWIQNHLPILRDTEDDDACRDRDNRLFSSRVGDALVPVILPGLA